MKQFRSLPAIGAVTLGIALTILLASSAHAQGAVTMKNKSYAVGQKFVFAIQGGEIENGLKVEVLRDGKPAAGETVEFRLLHAEGKGAEVIGAEAVTGPNGVASATIKLGDKSGAYIVSAFHQGELDIEPVQIAVRAYRTAWVWFLVFGMLGGLAIFLYGMELGAEGLQKAAGDSMRTILGKLTSNRFMGVVVGTLTTAAVQSSSATTVMVIGFVTASLMTLSQATGVIFGANIGTTLTVQLIAFNVSDYAPAMIGIGFVMMMLSGKRQGMKYTGKIILGFGFIFFGMALMSDAMNPLRSVPAFTNILTLIGDRPLLGVIFSTIFTAIIQSSGAIIGISIALAAAGVLTLPAAIVITFGANIGTTATAMLSSLGASREGKRVALVHLIFNTMGVVIFFPFIGPFTKLIVWVTERMGTDSLTRQIANAHMFFNIINTIVFLPFVNPLARFVTRIIPEKKDGKEPFKPQFIVGAEEHPPEIALELAHKETHRMAEIVEGMVKNVHASLSSRRSDGIEALKKEDDKVDTLQEAIGDFLAHVSQRNVSKELSHEIAYYLHVVDDLEHVGDVISKDVVALAEKLVQHKVIFSEEEAKGLADLHDRISKLYTEVFDAFESKNAEEAKDVHVKYAEIKALARKLDDEHIQAVLKAGRADPVKTVVYTDILDVMRALASHINLVADTILEYA